MAVLGVEEGLFSPPPPSPLSSPPEFASPLLPSYTSHAPVRLVKVKERSWQIP